MISRDFTLALVALFLSFHGAYTQSFPDISLWANGPQAQNAIPQGADVGADPDFSIIPYSAANCDSASQLSEASILYYGHLIGFGPSSTSVKADPKTMFKPITSLIINRQTNASEWMEFYSYTDAGTKDLSYFGQELGCNSLAALVQDMSATAQKVTEGPNVGRYCLTLKKPVECVMITHK